MLSFLAQSTPRTNTAALNPISYEDGRTTQHFSDPSAKYLVRIKTPATTIKHGRSFFNPPMHYHACQNEEFHVISGSARFFLDGQTHIRKAGDIQFIPKGAYHCYETTADEAANGNTEDLVIEFRLDEQNAEKEEQFFRNFFGYLDDCQKAGQNPSVFQLFRFLHSLEAPLAFSVPGMPKWVSMQASWWMMVVMGPIIGGWLLGYKENYEEYYAGVKAK
jgi:mannose-6-phosphate isomerase-like protein (cupin superfamily)